MRGNEAELVSNPHEPCIWASNFGSQTGIPYVLNGINNKIYKALFYRSNEIISL